MTLTHSECTRTSRLFLRDVTPVPPLALLLMSGDAVEASCGANGCNLVLDGWLTIELSASATELVMHARSHAHNRWQRMVDAAAMGVHSNERRLAWASGRFDGQLLLEALQPLLEQHVVHIEPPMSKGAVARRTGGKRGLIRLRRRAQRRQRSRMACALSRGRFISTTVTF